MNAIAAALDRLTERIGRLEKAANAPPRKAWKPREVAAMTGLGYETVLELIHDGRLHAVKVGQLYVVPDAELDRFLTPGAEPQPEQPSASVDVSVLGATPRSATYHRNKGIRSK